MKLTKTRLKQIIKEELLAITELETIGVPSDPAMGAGPALGAFGVGPAKTMEELKQDHELVLARAITLRAKTKEELGPLTAANVDEYEKRSAVAKVLFDKAKALEDQMQARVIQGNKEIALMKQSA
jgi:hypothetical protein